MSFVPINNMKQTSMMLDLIAEKQKALGSNLANIDTPGYVRKDINFGEYLGSVGSPLETKLSEKLGPSAIIEDRSFEEIDPAKELMELQKNSIKYTMATRQMTSIISQMRTVINVGK